VKIKVAQYSIQSALAASSGERQRAPSATVGMLFIRQKAHWQDTGHSETQGHDVWWVPNIRSRCMILVYIAVRRGGSRVVPRGARAEGTYPYKFLSAQVERRRCSKREYPSPIYVVRDQNTGRDIGIRARRRVCQRPNRAQRGPECQCASLAKACGRRALTYARLQRHHVC